MDWSTLKNIPAWYPLSKIDTEYEIADNLYKIGDEQYILTVGHNQKLEPTPPCITIIMWAVTDRVAERIVKQKIEADNGRISLPPREVLLPGEPCTYGEIIQNLHAANNEIFFEKLSYRISDGVFIYREIQTPSYSFFFRGFEEDNNETPCAIQYKLLQK